MVLYNKKISMDASMFYGLKKYILKRKNRKNASAAKSIITAAYQELLGRMPAQEEVDSWTERFMESGFGAFCKNFFNAVANSEELKNRFFASNFNDIRSEISGLLSGNFNDIRSEISGLLSGIKDITVKDVRLAVGQDIARAVVESSYEEFLGRKPAEKEAQYWLDALESRGITYGGFFNAISNAAFKPQEPEERAADENGGGRNFADSEAEPLNARFGEVVDKLHELKTGERFSRERFEKIMKIRNSRQIISDGELFALKYAFLSAPRLNLNNFDKIIYFHIPKCAGNSVIKYFENFIGKNDMLRFNAGGFVLDDGAWLEEWDFLFGFAKFVSVAHCDLDLCLKIPGNNLIVSFFREPESRLLSAYYYFRSHGFRHIASIPKKSGDAVVLSSAKTDSLANFLKNKNPYVLNNIDNNITRCLTGFFARGGDGGDEDGGWGEAVYSDELHKDEGRTLEIALKNLEKIGLIGITEEFDRSIGYFSKILGTEPPNPGSYYENVTEKNVSESSFYEKIQKEPVGGEIKKDLEKLTRLDKIVYERAVEIYKERIEKI